LSEKGSVLQIRLDKADGLMIAEVTIPKDANWNTVEAKVSKTQIGIHNLVVVLKDNNSAEIDWIKFK
jgi:hypothetical protein